MYLRYTKYRFVSKIPHTFFSKIITNKSGVRGIYDIMSLGPQRDESNQSKAYTYLPTSVGIDEFDLYSGIIPLYYEYITSFNMNITCMRRYMIIY